MIDNSKKRLLSKSDHDIMGIPERFRGASWSLLKKNSKSALEPRLKELHNFIRSGGSFFVYGPPSSGKSQLAAYLSKLFRSYSYTVQWVSAVDLQDHLYNKSQWDDNLTQRERFLSVDVLVVDALGAEIPAVFRGRNFPVEILKKRYEWNKTTIVTTNLPFSELKESYGEGFFTWLKKSFAGVPCVDE